VPFTATTFAPVIMLADNSCMVMVPADSPFKDLKDFVEAARKRPGEVTSVTPARAAVPHGGAGVPELHQGQV